MAFYAQHPTWKTKIDQAKRLKNIDSDKKGF